MGLLKALSSLINNSGKPVIF